MTAFQAACQFCASCVRLACDIEYVMRNTHVPAGPWCGVNTNQNAVSMECFIEGWRRPRAKDPLEFRRSTSTPTSCRIAEMPKVETVLVPTYDFWGGVGEPTVCVVASAVCRDRQAGAQPAAEEREARVDGGARYDFASRARRNARRCAADTGPRFLVSTLGGGGEGLSPCSGRDYSQMPLTGAGVVQW